MEIIRQFVRLYTNRIEAWTNLLYIEEFERLLMKPSIYSRFEPTQISKLRKHLRKVKKW